MQNNYIHVPSTGNLVEFEMVAWKLGTRSPNTSFEVNLLSVCCEFVIELGEVGNYVSSVCDNMANNCDKSVEIINLCPTPAKLLLCIQKSTINRNS